MTQANIKALGAGSAGSLAGAMGLIKELTLLIAVVSCFTSATSIRVDTQRDKEAKPSQKNPLGEQLKEERVALAQSRDSFNPGHTQHGGWRKPESEILVEAQHQGGNQWKAGDFAGYNPTIASQYEGQGTSYHPGPGIVQVASYPSVSASDSIKFSNSVGSGHGGDLIVGQGSVQRPANAPPASGVTYGQATSYPKKSGQDYVQTLTAGNAKPAVVKSEYPEYVPQHQNSGGNHRGVAPQVKPAASKYPGQFSLPGGQPVNTNFYSQSSPFAAGPQQGHKAHPVNKFPQNRPSYPGQGGPKVGGARYPPGGGGGSGRPGPGPAKFPGPVHKYSQGPLQLQAQGSGGSFYFPKPYGGAASSAYSH